MRENLRQGALVSLVFMAGLAVDRALSWIVDGTPHPILIIYLGLELVFGGIGVALLRKGDTGNVSDR